LNCSVCCSSWAALMKLSTMMVIGRAEMHAKNNLLKFKLLLSL
jgi:hypothetical protein